MKINLYIAVALVAMPAFAKAPNWAEDCRAEGKKALALCEAITKDAGAADIGQAAANSAALGSGAIINRGAQTGVNQAVGQTGRLQTALTACQKAELECAQKCDQEEQDRMSHASGPPQNPMTIQAQKQAGRVIEAKQTSCIAPLKALETKLASGLAEAKRAAGESAATRDATPMMPQMPQNQPKGGSEGGEKSSEPLQNTATKSPLENLDKIPTVTPKTTDCKTDPNAANLDQCKKDLVETCTKGYNAGTSDGRCDGFTARYCNANPPPAESGNLMNPSASRPGEGIGSNYCNLAVSHDFCKDPARKDCMTCQNYRNYTSPDCQLNSENCAKDTSQELAAQNCKDPEPPLSASTFSNLTSPVAGGDGSSPAANAGLGGAGVGPQTANDSAIAGGDSGLPKLNMEIGAGGAVGGGGSGSSSRGSYSSQSSGPSYSSQFEAKGRAPSSVVEEAGEKGLNLFSIGTAVFENMCSQNRLHHCRPK